MSPPCNPASARTPFLRRGVWPPVCSGGVPTAPSADRRHGQAARWRTICATWGDRPATQHWCPTRCTEPGESGLLTHPIAHRARLGRSPDAVAVAAVPCPAANSPASVPCSAATSPGRATLRGPATGFDDALVSSGRVASEWSWHSPGARATPPTPSHTQRCPSRKLATPGAVGDSATAGLKALTVARAHIVGDTRNWLASEECRELALAA